MSSTDWASGPCAIGRAASVLGDRWSLLILRNAMLGHTRFDQFKKNLGIADNILSNRLSKLVDEGLLVREDYDDGARVRQHYRLTRAGAEFRTVLEALARWGQENARPEAAEEPMEVIHVTCGTALDDGRFCPTCNTAVGGADVAWMMPWFSEAPVPLAAPIEAVRG